MKVHLWRTSGSEAKSLKVKMPIQHDDKIYSPSISYIGNLGKSSI